MKILNNLYHLILGLLLEKTTLFWNWGFIQGKFGIAWLVITKIKCLQYTNASQFEVVSDKVPTNWRIYQLKSGSLHLGPKAWQPLGFWEDCYDLKPDALEIYKREARIIYEEENT
jgi:hypothetical protein